jgi:hypothetical protein
MSGFRRVLLSALVALVPAAAAASSTPVPGGANEVKALSGKLGDTIFNGVLRIKADSLAYTTSPEDVAEVNTSGGKKVMKLTVLLRNGSKDDFTDLMSYTLADKDDVTLSIGSFNLHPGNLHILQGAAARQTAIFTVDPSFVPVKLIVQCASCSARSGFRAVRFSIPAPQQP